MKRNWLLYLVIFSLALNLGTIGTFAYLRSQDRREVASKETTGTTPPAMHFREMWGSLNLDGEQRQALHSLLPEHRRKVMEMRRDLGQKRRELFDLLKVDAPAWSAIQAKIREISALQGNLEEEVARFLLEFNKHLRPEQHAAFLNLVQERMCGPGGMGPGFGPPPGRGMGLGRGPGMGRGRGMGMGPVPPGPPSPPAMPPK